MRRFGEEMWSRFPLLIFAMAVTALLSNLAVYFHLNGLRLPLLVLQGTVAVLLIVAAIAGLRKGHPEPKMPMRQIKRWVFVAFFIWGIAASLSLLRIVSG